LWSDLGSFVRIYVLLMLNSGLLPLSLTRRSGCRAAVGGWPVSRVLLGGR
jgi:hypothetical protein